MDEAQAIALLEGRTDLVALSARLIHEAVAALQRSLPTMEHAAQLQAALVDALGARAWEDPDRALSRRLFVGEAGAPEWLIPVPLAELHFADQDLVVELQLPVALAQGAPPPRPVAAPPPTPAAPLDLAPRTASMRAGWLRIAEGRRFVLLVYGANGQIQQFTLTGGDPFTIARHAADRPFALDPTARPPAVPPPSLLCRGDLDPGGHPIADLARMAAALDPGADLPVRIRLPAPLPHGPQIAWGRVVGPLRRALWEARVPDGARHLAADAFLGNAIAWGASRDEAVGRLETQIAAGEAPNPVEWNVRALETHGAPQPPAEAVLPDGRRVAHLNLQVPVELPTQLTWPSGPAHTPAVALPLPAPPGEPPAAFARAGFSRWVRLLGDSGAIAHALVRDDPNGCTVVGEGVLDLVDPAALEGLLDAHDQAASAPWDGKPAQNPWRAPSRRVHYHVWDAVRRCAIPPIAPPSAPGLPAHPEIDQGPPAALLDGDAVKWQVVRYREG
jgi:hypothetical protein